MHKKKPHICVTNPLEQLMYVGHDVAKSVGTHTEELHSILQQQQKTPCLASSSNRHNNDRKKNSHLIQIGHLATLVVVHFEVVQQSKG